VGRRRTAKCRLGFAHSLGSSAAECRAGTPLLAPRSVIVVRRMHRTRRAGEHLLHHDHGAQMPLASLVHRF